MHGENSRRVPNARTSDQLTTTEQLDHDRIRNHIATHNSNFCNHRLPLCFPHKLYTKDRHIRPWLEPVLVIQRFTLTSRLHSFSADFWADLNKSQHDDCIGVLSHITPEDQLWQCQLQASPEVKRTLPSYVQLFLCWFFVSRRTAGISSNDQCLSASLVVAYYTVTTVFFPGVLITTSLFKALSNSLFLTPIAYDFPTLNKLLLTYDWWLTAPWKSRPFYRNNWIFWSYRHASTSLNSDPSSFRETANTEPPRFLSIFDQGRPNAWLYKRKYYSIIRCETKFSKGRQPSACKLLEYNVSL